MKRSRRGYDFASGWGTVGTPKVITTSQALHDSRLSHEEQRAVCGGGRAGWEVRKKYSRRY